MCKTSIDYSNTHIYRICANDPTIEQQYVGSTTNLTKRRSQHKCSTTNPRDKSYNQPKYVFIREHGGWDVWSVVLIETYAAENSEDARRRERHWIEFYASQLNTNIPIRSADETPVLDAAYRAANKGRTKVNSAKYYILNKEKMNLYQIIYRAANKERVSQINAKYRAANAEHITANRVKYQDKKKALTLAKKIASRAGNKKREYMAAYYQRKKAEKAEL